MAYFQTRFPFEVFNVFCVLSVEFGRKRMQTIWWYAKSTRGQHLHYDVMILTRSCGNNVNREQDACVIVEFFHELKSIVNIFVPVDERIVYVYHDRPRGSLFVLVF